MKRTFIPPSHRPYVRGTKLNRDENQETTHDLQNPRVRRNLISMILADSPEAFELNNPSFKEILKEFFPGLRNPIICERKDGSDV